MYVAAGAGFSIIEELAAGWRSRHKRRTYYKTGSAITAAAALSTIDKESVTQLKVPPSTSLSSILPQAKR